MVRPLVPGQNLLEQAVPMGEILKELAAQLAELKAYKESEGPILAQA